MTTTTATTAPKTETVHISRVNQGDKLTTWAGDVCEVTHIEADGIGGYLVDTRDVLTGRRQWCHIDDASMIPEVERVVMG